MDLSLILNWLQVLGTAERSQVNQGVCDQLHAIVSLLNACKSQKQPFAVIFPCEGPLNTHSQRMDGFMEEACASTLGALAMTGILFDVGDHTGIEHALPITCGIKAAIEIDIGASEVQPDFFGYLLQRFE